MQHRHKRQCKQQEAFTMIELLVVIGIMGILAAIAIARYVTYTQRGYDARAEALLRAAAASEEAYYVDNASYLSCDESNCEALLPNIPPIESGISIELTGDASGFTGTATHANGSGKVHSWPPS